MAQRHTVTMRMMRDGSPRGAEARRQLAGVLPEAAISEPDEVGVFEIVLAAVDEEDALLQVWDGVAAAGVDDHVAFLEHPDLPEHWRHRAKRPSA